MRHIDSSIGRAAPRVLATAPNRHIAAAVGRADLYSGGRFRVRGTVTVSGTPAQRRVVLFDGALGQRPLQPIRATWSAADGSYSFERVADREYFVIAFDYARDKNAAIADLVRPEPMP